MQIKDVSLARRDHSTTASPLRQGCTEITVFGGYYGGSRLSHTTVLRFGKFMLVCTLYNTSHINTVCMCVCMYTLPTLHTSTLCMCVCALYQHFTQKHCVYVSMYVHYTTLHTSTLYVCMCVHSTTLHKSTLCMYNS